MTLLTSAENHLNRATQDIGFFGPGSSGVYIDENGGVVLEHETGQTVTVKDDFDVTGTITGTLNLTQLQLEDDEQLQFGDAPDYWWEYESANTRLRLRSSDIDGGGTDGDILRVPDGTQDLEKVGGQLLLPDGSAAAPGMTFANETSVGFTRLSGEAVGVDENAEVFLWNSNGFRLLNDVKLGWSSIFGASDLELHRDAADTLALRRSNNNNALRIYNEFTDASNYARLAFVTADGAYTLSPQAAGTGTLRGLTIGETGTSLGFFGATPVAQPTTAIAEATFVENSGGTAVNVDSTFGGYTLQQIAQALQDLGALA